MAGTGVRKTPNALPYADDGRSVPNARCGIDRGVAPRRAPAFFRRRRAPLRHRRRSTTPPRPAPTGSSSRGDGSIAPAAAAAGRRRTTARRHPGRTANDFAHDTGLPTSISAACRLAVHGTRLQSMELGWMNESAPSNVASAGLPVPAASAPRRKDRLGPLAYAAGALSAGHQRQAHSPVSSPAWPRTPGRARRGRSPSLLRSRSAPALHRGGRSNRRALEVVAIEAGSRLSLVSLVYHPRRGTLTSHPRAFHAAL